ncbi:unnamed protein product [Durusdinium trenchii]|uniref:Uncharacterized protein n=1 Tax=Durusdinium trenchii TaxID=1381693 RepID=A0ABP0JUN0_9DINO
MLGCTAGTIAKCIKMPTNAPSYWGTHPKVHPKFGGVDVFRLILPGFAWNSFQIYLYSTFLDHFLCEIKEIGQEAADRWQSWPVWHFEDTASSTKSAAFYGSFCPKAGGVGFRVRSRNKLEKQQDTFCGYCTLKAVDSASAQDPRWPLL